jgi:excisionase family DNA binding protein
MPGIKIGDMELYDVEELSKLLDVQERTIRAYLREGKLQGRKMARKWYVTADSLKAYFHQSEEGAKLQEQE